jgi:hypothetical protein
MSDTNRPPLWRQMQRAADAAMATYHPCATDEQLLAAEIGALRDWLLPDEGPRPDLSHAGAQWDDRQRLRDLLTAEADRAERGDD